MSEFFSSPDVKTYLAALRSMVPRAYGVVYLITNMDNGKQYVGQTINKVPFERYRRHLKDARFGVDHPLCRAIRKYGDGAFRFEILANCDDRRALDAAEDFFIVSLRTLSPDGYNLHRGGANGRFSADLRARLKLLHGSPETSRRHSAAMSRCWSDSEHRQKIKDTWAAKRLLIPPKPAKLTRAEALRESLARPGFLEKRNAAIKASRADPKVRERIGAGTRGRRWIFNGQESRRLKPSEMLPEGWSYGRGNTHGR